MSTVAAQSRRLFDALQQRCTLVEMDGESPDGHERRDCPRYEIRSGDVTVLVAPQDESVQQVQLLVVSQDGVRLKMEPPPSPGEVVRLVFDLGETQIEINAEVRHAGADQADRYVGLRFTDALVGPPAPLPVVDTADDN